MLSQHFNKWLREAGVDATANRLRHWFGMNVYQQTRDLRLTQELLGHAEPQTTAVYCAYDRSAAAKVVGTLGFEVGSWVPIQFGGGHSTVAKRLLRDTAHLWELTSTAARRRDLGA
jgi:Phage integrase family